MMGRAIAVSAVVLIASLSAAPQAPEDGAKLVKASDCSSCHAADHEVFGPAYVDMAKRYAGQSAAMEKLAAKIRDGGGGMTPHPDLTDAQRREIVKWILSMNGGDLLVQSEFPHTLKDGTTVNLDFPIYEGGKGPKVTKEVFHGYQLFNSYCYRCHGTDATGGQLAPDLRRSLAGGMKRQEFVAVAAAGKAEKGMPSWAGFLSGDELFHIYQYVKGRSLDLVPSGRPPSAQD
jgi:cytochrome c